MGLHNHPVLYINGRIELIETYFVFAGDAYDHCGGGCDDLIGIFNNFDEAVQKIKDSDPDWAHIASFTGSKLIKLFEYGEYGAFVGSGEKKQWKDIQNDEFREL